MGGLFGHAGPQRARKVRRVFFLFFFRTFFFLFMPEFLVSYPLFLSFSSRSETFFRRNAAAEALLETPEAAAAAAAAEAAAAAAAAAAGTEAPVTAEGEQRPRQQ